MPNTFLTYTVQLHDRSQDYGFSSQAFSAQNQIKAISFFNLLLDFYVTHLAKVTLGCSDVESTVFFF